MKTGQTPNVSVAMKVRGNTVKQLIIETLRSIAKPGEQRELRAVTS